MSASDRPTQTAECQVVARTPPFACLRSGGWDFAAAHAALGTAVVLPPLTQPASGEHHVGKVVWTDLVTPDLEGAKRFYGGLFG
jgi:hypothetical protein